MAKPNGGDDYIRTGDVAAANPKVLRAMLKAMGPPAPTARSAGSAVSPVSERSGAK